MGFEWARPTTFDDPMFTVGGSVDYYAVDHSPSYLWNSATWENSEALLPFLPIVTGRSGRVGRRRDHQPGDRDPRGTGQNPAILSFQGRSAEHPHRGQLRRLGPGTSASRSRVSASSSGSVLVGADDRS